MKLIKFPQANQSNERCEEKSIALQKKHWQAASRRDLEAWTVISGKGEYQATGLRDQEWAV